MVLTRPIPESPFSGRERTLGFIRRALQADCDVATFELTSALHGPGLRRIGSVVATLLRGLLSGKPCPLQMALFHDPHAAARLAAAITSHAATAVVFDSVRSTGLMPTMRRRFPQLALVADFDDLMSLRFERLLARRLPISLGYLESAVPRWLRSPLRRGWLTRLVLRYEAGALKGAERRALEVASAATVVSTVDAEHLQAAVAPHLARRVVVLPPGVAFPSPHIRTRACREFLFVGSDTLLQNRLTIEYLLQLWSQLRPSTPLRIVGRMTATYPACDGVIFAGFVKDLAELYSDDRIALCPAFVEGGIKTKVLEALGQGVVPIGNSLTFEGMGCDAGALALSEDALRAAILNPAAHLSQFLQAAQGLRDCAQSRYSLEAVTAAWMRLVAPQPPSTQA